MPPLVAGPLAGCQVSIDSAFESEAAQKSGKGIAPLDAKPARRRQLPGHSPVSSALVDPRRLPSLSSSRPLSLERVSKE